MRRLARRVVESVPSGWTIFRYCCNLVVLGWISYLIVLVLYTYDVSGGF